MQMAYFLPTSSLQYTNNDNNINNNNKTATLASILSQTSSEINTYVTTIKKENNDLKHKIKRIRKERFKLKEQLNYLMKKFDQESKEYEIYEIKVQRKVKTLKKQLKESTDKLTEFKKSNIKLQTA